MVSYNKYRDIGAVLTAGTTLTPLGQEFRTAVFTKAGTVPLDENENPNLPDGAFSSGGTIRTAAAAAFKGDDEYGDKFHKTYKDNQRDDNALTNAAAVAAWTRGVGPNVVKVATTILSQDAVNAAAIAQAYQDQQS